MPSQVIMPKLSDAMTEGRLLQWLKKEGDRVQGGDVLASIETDKAEIELESLAPASSGRSSWPKARRFPSANSSPS